MTKTRLLTGVAFACVSLCSADAQQELVLDSTTKIVSDGRADAYLPALFTKSHAANLLQAKNGDLWCTWMSGDAGNSILLSKRAKGSTTWSKPSIVFAAEGKLGFDNPMLFEAPSGALWMFAAKEGHVVVRISQDHAVTWTDHAMSLDANTLTREPMTILDNGTWALSLYAAPTPGITKGSESHHPVVALSSDQGTTWKTCVIDGPGLVQPAIFKVSKGHYAALLRSRYSDFLFRTESTDGCNWTPPVATTLPSNNGSVELVKLKNGDLAIAFNNTHVGSEHTFPAAGKRTPLSVAISKDNGTTWSAVRDLDAATTDLDSTDMKIVFGKNEFSYPSITQTASGKIAVAYTYQKKTIKVSEFPESWVFHGSSVGVYQPAKR